MKKFIFSIFFWTLLSNATLANTISWQSSAYNIIPNNNHISIKYCQQHSPDTFIISINKALSSGITANNGITIKYNSYDKSTKNGLVFITVHAVISGILNNQPWQEKMLISEQRLTENGDTNAVWSTDNCKGKLTGKVILSTV